MPCRTNWLMLFQGLVQDRSRVESLFTCPIEDLVAAAGAWGGYERVIRHLPYLGEEAQFSDLHTEFVVFGFVTKRTGHTTTARFQEADHEMRWKAQRLCREISPGKGFLMAVPMYDDRLLSIGKLLGTDTAGIGFAHEEFFEQQGVLTQFLRIFPLYFRYEAGIFVPETKNSRWFQPHQRFFSRNER